MFTTDASIAANNFVVLEDPKNNFAAQNVVPLINKAKVNDTVKQTLNAVSAKLTTEELTNLNAEASCDAKPSPETVAKNWLRRTASPDTYRRPRRRPADRRSADGARSPFRRSTRWSGGSGRDRRSWRWSPTRGAQDGVRITSSTPTRCSWPRLADTIRLARLPTEAPDRAPQPDAHCASLVAVPVNGVITAAPGSPPPVGVDGRLPGVVHGVDRELVDAQLRSSRQLLELRRRRADQAEPVDDLVGHERRRGLPARPWWE